MEGFSFDTMSCLFGYFNSDLAFSGLRQSPKRTVRDYEMEVILEDGGVTYMDGRAIPVHAGMVLFAAPGAERYSVLPLKSYYLKIPMGESPMTKLMGSMPAWYDSAYVDLYRNCIEQMIYARAKQDEWLEASALFRLFSFLKEENKQLSLIGAASGQEVRMVNRAVRYMRDNLMRKCTLSDIAASVHLSPFYFHTVFRKVRGETPQACLTRFRIEKAVELLLTSDQEIRTIAEACGFSSQSYFTEVFRKHMDMPPRTYRIRMMQKYIR